MTQALALRKMLSDNGHEVCEVLIGKSPIREIPTFFTQRVGVPVNSFESPNFAPTPQQRHPRIFPSILNTLLRARTYLGSILYIRSRIRAHQPDVVVNFYDLLCGLTYGIFRLPHPMICIGHQFLLEHPAFPFPPGKKQQARLVRLLTSLTSLNASLRLALSIYPLEHPPGKNIQVVPPLLRQALFAQQPVQEDYILGYMLNPGFAEEIIQWHQHFPDIRAEFFWDKKDAPEVYSMRPNLTFHRINDLKFLQMLAGCKGFATTGGFESVCEAMYLGKPVLMVPAHIEQACNAYDAMLQGAGIISDHFSVEKLVSYIPHHQSSSSFRAWVHQAESIFMQQLTCLPAADRNGQTHIRWASSWA